MVRAPVRALGALVLALLSVLALGGCSADDSSPPPDRPPGEDVAMAVSSVRLPGIDEETRTELESEMGDVLASYIVAGYLGDHPRDDYARSLADFTDGLAQEGGRDLAGLTLSGISDVASVRATRLDVRLAFFDPDDRTSGASAFVDLAFEVTLEDGTTRTVERTGRLLLLRVGGAWRIGGYHLCCTEGAAVDGGVS